MDNNKQDKLYRDVLKLIAFPIADREVVKQKFDRAVRDLAKGRKPERLSGPERWQLGSVEPDCGLSDHEMPRDICRLLGFKAGATYGELI